MPLQIQSQKEPDKVILNFMWLNKGPIIVKTFLKKRNKLGKLALSNGKTYIRPSKMKYGGLPCWHSG